jgi:hypothetical protein
MSEVTPVAAATRPVQCIALAWRLRERQLDHAVDQRAAGNGGKQGFLILSHSRPAPPSHMNRYCEHPAGFRNRSAQCRPSWVTKRAYLQ